MPVKIRVGRGRERESECPEHKESGMEETKHENESEPNRVSGEQSDGESELGENRLVGTNCTSRDGRLRGQFCGGEVSVNKVASVSLTLPQVKEGKHPRVEERSLVIIRPRFHEPALLLPKLGSKFFNF